MFLLPSSYLVPRRSIERLTVGVVALLTFGLLQWWRHRAVRAIDRELLTYPDVITYFVEKRPADESIRRGALLRQRQASFWLLSFMFLNEAGAICSGADGKQYRQKLSVRALDQEMMELFADKDLVVFE